MPFCLLGRICQGLFIAMAGTGVGGQEETHRGIFDPTMEAKTGLCHRTKCCRVLGVGQAAGSWEEGRVPGRVD